MSTFRSVFVEVFQICHSLNFVNMRFAVKVIFFPVEFYKKIYFHGKFITEFCYFFFCSQQFSPLFNKTGKLQVFVLYLPKYLCLEYTKYKTPPKECRQGINNLMQHLDLLLTYV